MAHSLAVTTEVSSPDTLEKIENILRTDVIDVLRGCFDSLASLDRPAAYEAVMNEPFTLHQAFDTLNHKPELFAAVLVDDQGEPAPPRDDSRLRCGATLGHIKLLILRAVARRHFRNKLGGPQRVVQEPPAPNGIVERMKHAVGAAKPRPQRFQRMPGKGDTLYRAIRNYLLFDWQAKLLPAYSRFTPELVETLGKELLQIREPAELDALAGEEAQRYLKIHGRPLFLMNAHLLMKPMSDTIDAELLWKLWEQMNMTRLFGAIDAAEARKIIAEIAGTSKAAIDLLMPVLGHDARHFCTFLFVAYRSLGHTAFRDTFAATGVNLRAVTQYADRMQRLPGLPPPVFEDMVELFALVLTPVHEGAQSAA